MSNVILEEVGAKIAILSGGCRYTIPNCPGAYIGPCYIEYERSKGQIVCSRSQGHDACKNVMNDFLPKRETFLQRVKLVERLPQIFGFYGCIVHCFVLDTTLTALLDGCCGGCWDKHVPVMNKLLLCMVALRQLHDVAAIIITEMVSLAEN
jgi:hypothetical protein